MSEFNRYSQYEPLFGSWYIKRKIGRGAIGQVYEIEREDLGTTYRAALKAITIPEDEEDIKRVLSTGVTREDLPEYYRKLILNMANEFKYLAKLKGNSYIVNYEDHQIIENTDEMRWDVLIKTELLTPLVEHVIEHPMSENDVLKLGIDLCRALQYCSQYNILHRDIKPENIFIAPSGDYKLGDFGIARVVEETYVNLSRKGTYTYMAPEVFHGQKYDQSADLYSLGLVMYKFLNHGRIPFMPAYPAKIEYDDAEKAFSERMAGKAITPPSGGSGKLRKIILKACAYRREDRYASADEMLADLEKLWLSTNKKYTGFIKRPDKKKTADSAAGKETEKGKVHESTEAPKSGKAHESSSAPKGGKAHESTETPKSSRELSGKKLEGRKAAENSRVPEDNKALKLSMESERNNVPKSTRKDNRKNSGTFRRFIIAAIMACMILAGTGIYISIPKEVTDITGLESSIKLYYDEIITPKYTVEPDWFKDEKITFSSSDESVFKVSGSGAITAVSIGEADLTMTAKEYTETVHVSVVPKVTAINDIDGSYSLYTGGTVQLKPVLEPAEFAEEPVEYSSSDENVATVDDQGIITAVSPGEAEITIASGGTSTTATVTVTAPVVRRTKSSGSSGSSGKKSGSKKDSFGDAEYF